MSGEKKWAKYIIEENGERLSSCRPQGGRRYERAVH